LREAIAMAADATPVCSPATLQEGLKLLAEGGPDLRLIAGGTDAMVRLQEGRWRPRAWVSLHRLRPALAFVRAEAGTVTIGALTTYTELLADTSLQRLAPLLLQAARTVGGPQIRNMGTLGGNLGTASPAGDSLPALYALEARVHLTSLAGERVLPVAAFIPGPGQTALRPGELITAISFPAQSPDERCTYEKLGLRAAHAIAIASSAIRLRPGPAPGAWVALGAVAPTVVRVAAAEAALARGGIAAAAAAAAAARDAAHPITDIRGTAAYRQAMAGNLVLRGLARLLGREALEGRQGV
jgi:xanthine dehydrogenase FAD-binding subunit